MIPTKTANQFDYTKFIYYHPSTKGGDGRAVYIDPQLIVRFMEIIDSLGAKGVEVARGIINLKSTAAGLTSDSNKTNVGQHRHNIQNVAVTYTVLQNGGRGAGVYITDLQHSYSSDQGRPGLYKVERSTRVGQPWMASSIDSNILPSLVGVLGAVPPSEDGISGATQTAIGFAVGSLKNEFEGPSKNLIENGFSLFYTPSYVIDNMGTWLTSDQKLTSGSINCPQAFARLLVNTENKSKGEQRYRWYIVGSGAKVFQQALKEYKHLSKQPLNRSHEFYFVDPQVPLGLLHQDLRDNGFDPGRDKSIVNGSMTTASQAHQLIDPTQTYTNMYKPFSQFMAIKAAANEATKVLKTRSSTTVCFSDLVKNLSTALNKRW